MKPVVKYGVIAAVVIAVLLGAVAAVLYSVVDTEFIKREAARAAKEQTGRDLVFKGDVSISVFPWLGVKLGPLALSNAAGFGDAPMAEIASTEVKVKLLPLFSGTVEVGSVLVDGLALNLGRDKGGRTNFDDIVERAGAAKGEEREAPAAKEGGDSGGGGGGLPISGLSVGGVRVSGASLVWDDRMLDKRYAVSDLTVTTGALALGQPFDLALSAKAEASDPALRADVDLKTRADLGKDFKTPSLQGLKLTLGAEGDPVPGGPVEAVISGDIVVDLNDSTVTVSGLTLSAYDLTAKGGVKVSKFDTAPVVDATLDLAGFDPKKLMARLGMTPPATKDPAALTKAAVSFKARATQDAASLADLSLTLDDTKLTGKAAVKNFARPAITFDLSADALDADRYLPPGGGDAAEAEPAPAPAPAGKDGAKDEPAGLPKEELKKLDVDGTLRVGKLTVYNVRMSDMQVTIKARDGVIRITPLSAGLYGGLFKTSLLADVSGKATKTKVDLGLAGLGLGGLLTDLLGEDKVTGTAALDLSLAAVGDEWKSMVRTLSGSGSVGLKNGAFKGFQVIPQAVRTQAAAADPEKRVEKVEKQQTFKDISASFAIAKGLLTTGDTKLSADNMSALGKGGVNLVNQTIDYKAVVDITAVPKIPFTVTGALTDPSVSLDTAEFVKGLAQGVVNLPVKIGKGVLDGGKGALEGIGSGLKNLFGGGKKSEEKQ